MDKERIKEQWIALRCRLKEPEAFRELVDLMEQRLFYYIRRFVQDEQLAWDILQDVWMAVFKKIQRLRDTAAIRAWLYRITHDKIANYLREEETRKKVLVELAYQDTNNQISFSEGQAKEIHQLLEKLSPSHREVMVLFFLEGMRYKEIAEVTRCSLGTVKSRLYWAKKLLKEMISSKNQGGI
jgi:RNA polymerase sigma-70 factor (ECF subfamily)